MLVVAASPFCFVLGLRVHFNGVLCVLCSSVAHSLLSLLLAILHINLFTKKLFLVEAATK